MIGVVDGGSRAGRFGLDPECEALQTGSFVGFAAGGRNRLELIAETRDEMVVKEPPEAAASPAWIESTAASVFPASW